MSRMIKECANGQSGLPVTAWEVDGEGAGVRAHEPDHARCVEASHSCGARQGPRRVNLGEEARASVRKAYFMR